MQKKQSKEDINKKITTADKVIKEIFCDCGYCASSQHSYHTIDCAVWRITKGD